MTLTESLNSRLDLPLSSLVPWPRRILFLPPVWS